MKRQQQRSSNPNKVLPQVSQIELLFSQQRIGRRENGPAKTNARRIAAAFRFTFY
jgi:hypothetical protein